MGKITSQQHSKCKRVKNRDISSASEKLNFNAIYDFI